MAAEKGEEATEKGAMAAEKGRMGVEAAADEEKEAMEKGEERVKAADEEQGAPAVEKGEEDSTAADEEEGETAEGKGKKRETAAAEKEPTAGSGLEWKWKGASATAAGGEEGSKPKPRRQRRRWRSTRRDRGAAAKKKDEEKEDTAAAAAAAAEGSGEKTVFFFSAPAVRKTITLVSSEGRPFRMSEAAARLSAVLADMVDNGCAGGNIPLYNIDGRTLAMVIKYCDKHAAGEPESNHGTADDEGGADTAASKEALYKWDRKLVQDLTQDALFDLINAANFLDIKGLLEASCQKVADMIAKKTPAQVRTIFGIANDFTAEEEEELRKESPWVFDDEASDDEQV